MAPLHYATRESRRWSFQPSECSPVDTEKALKERDSSEPKKQNKFRPFVEESAVISKPRPGKALIPREIKAGPGPRLLPRLNYTLGPR